VVVCPVKNDWTIRNHCIQLGSVETRIDAAVIRRTIYPDGFRVLLGVNGENRLNLDQGGRIGYIWANMFAACE
jgi:hypothetical protein